VHDAWRLSICAEALPRGVGAWTAVEQIAPSRLLTEMSRPQLVAKRLDPSLGRRRSISLAYVWNRTGVS
jgi:hypothetical protein